MRKLEENFKQSGGFYKEFKIGDLFSVKSNPQLNKSSFVFNENAPYPYFTRTCLNNGISGYVEYLDEEHKIKGNAIAVGMLGMQFFYMEKDFYAGQFTKTIYPKFNYFNSRVARYFIVLFNKHSSVFLGVLVRDFEKIFYNSVISLPVLPSCNENKFEIAFEYMESYIKELEAERLEELEAYLLATGLKDYKLTEQEKVILQDFAKLQNEDSKRGGGHLVA